MAADEDIIRVPLGDRAYEIHVGDNELDRFWERIKALGDFRQIHVITDTTVAAILPEELRSPPTDMNMSVAWHLLPAGEPSKSPQELLRAWESLAARRANRDTLIVAIGGGVVGDLAGFVAASYARGLAWVQVPTTLLAQVDSSVGGKVGINLPQAKNIVGAFWQPRMVVIELRFLRTLPPRELSAGLAEVVKYGVIADPNLFDFLEESAEALLAIDSASMRHVVRRSCAIKGDIVGEDEREETGRRAVLNYGHTFGHALEATSGYGRWLHGEAVAIGMDCAARLAKRLGQVDTEFVSRQRRLLERLRLPTRLADDAPEAGALLDAMRHDKKSVGGNLRFVLPRALGQVELRGVVDERDVLAVLEDRS